MFHFRIFLAYAVPAISYKRGIEIVLVPFIPPTWHYITRSCSDGQVSLFSPITMNIWCTYVPISLFLLINLVNTESWINRQSLLCSSLNPSTQPTDLPMIIGRSFKSVPNVVTVRGGVIGFFEVPFILCHS